MSFATLIPFILGMIGILQGAFYRKISESIGLTHAVAIGNTFAFLLTIPIVIFIYKNPQWFPDYIQFKSPIGAFKWWYLVPGFFGIFIVFGLPMAITKIGAVRSTVLIIIAQIITSIAWDLGVEHLQLSLTKWIAMVLGVISAILMIVST